MTNIEIPKDIEGENLSQLIKNPDSNADRAALIMNVAPFGANFKDEPYRAIRTKQYTYALTPNGPSMFYDNLKDPYQQNNLLNQPEFSEVQKDLDFKLRKELKKIGDEVRPRDYYLKKWGYTFDENRRAINFWSWNEGKGVVQSPKPLSN